MAKGATTQQHFVSPANGGNECINFIWTVAGKWRRFSDVSRDRHSLVHWCNILKNNLKEFNIIFSLLEENGCNSKSRHICFEWSLQA